jgi:hypothetical protein
VTRARRCDDGRIALLVLGFVLVLVMMVAVVVDAAKLYLARRALHAATDGAALAAVQAVDLDALYAGEADDALPLDRRAARRAVDRYVETAELEDTLRGFEVVGVSFDGDEVTVRTRTLVRLPFVGPVTRGHSTVEVVAEATATGRLSDP